MRLKVGTLSNTFDCPLKRDSKSLKTAKRVTNRVTPWALLTERRTWVISGDIIANSTAISVEKVDEGGLSVGKRRIEKSVPISCFQAFNLDLITSSVKVWRSQKIKSWYCRVGVGKGLGNPFLKAS